ncbi:integrase [Gossypium australe]|uniref:Integrase n=1 Tax=Gossypium australe TaxID=47621 RepID=A0A5B6VAJ3_9ROSI|nr:integrase [Gossypium australe]
MLSDDGSIIAELKARPMFLQQIFEAQGRICVPKNPKLVQKILNEAHNGTMCVHPGSNKMYNDLKKMY